MKFLVVDSNIGANYEIGELLEEFGGGSVVERAYDEEKGLEQGLANKFDAVILAHAGSKAATRSFIQKFRQKCTAPLLVLVPRGDVDSRVDYLYCGADYALDYGCDRQELLAVIGSLVRRSTLDFGENIYRFKNLEVNFFDKSVAIDGERVMVVSKMFDVLEYLIRNKEIVISKETMFNRVWGYNSETTITVVEVYISKLRKLLADSGLATHLQTIKNAGYRWTEKQ